MAITSVSATIYGQTTPFTYNSETGKWVGTVTIPEHRGYTEEITLSATNSTGQTATYSLDDIYIFILLYCVTDRTEQDVARVKELIQKWHDGTLTEDEITEWASDLKGSLNKSDIQRIFNNLSIFDTNYISKIAEESQTTFTWSDFSPLLTDDIPLEEHFTLLANALDQLHAYAGEHDMLTEEVPATPNMPFNTIKAWNDIEAIIEKIYLRTIDHHI